MLAGELTCNGKPLALGTWVCATLMTSGVEEGEPTMYGLSPSLPAAQTTTTPARTAMAEAALKSSCTWPYGEPSDMLITSTASERSPSLFGSSAKSMASSSATPLQALERVL